MPEPMTFRQRVLNTFQRRPVDRIVWQPRIYYWYNGRPASKDLPGITGKVGDIKKGQTRDGGSFQKRSTKYSSWNSFFTQNVYQVKKVNDFISA